jgi:diguanylate cyclase (GGDEF)-like protein
VSESNAFARLRHDDGVSDSGDRDRLTGLYSHRFFRDALARELARDRRYAHPVTLIVFDIDDFKQINDRYGHAAGDAILAALASRLRTIVRASDLASRIGGDEFAIILPESGLDDAQAFWARCQDELAAKPYEYAGLISVSCGIADFDPSEDATAFFGRADLALHQAKTAGKGELAVAAPPDPQSLAEGRHRERRRGWKRSAQPHGRRQWEYWVEHADPDVERLNELGAQGWELIATVGGKLIFKRRKRTDETPPPEPGVREPLHPGPPTGPAAA